jgi:hypothetical protein
MNNFSKRLNSKKYFIVENFLKFRYIYKTNKNQIQKQWNTHVTKMGKYSMRMDTK